MRLAVVCTRRKASSFLRSVHSISRLPRYYLHLLPQLVDLLFDYSCTASELYQQAHQHPDAYALQAMLTLCQSTVHQPHAERSSAQCKTSLGSGALKSWRRNHGDMRFTCGAGGVFDWVGALEGGVHQELIVPQILHLQTRAALSQGCRVSGVADSAYIRQCRRLRLKEGLLKPQTWCPIPQHRQGCVQGPSPVMTTTPTGPPVGLRPCQVLNESHCSANLPSVSL